MGIPATAKCEWFDRQYGSTKWEPYNEPNEIVECRASVGERIVTVWLPKGAIIRLRLSRFGNNTEAWSREFRHTFGADRDKQIRIKLVPKREEDD